jgi:hypothetical protein
LTDQILATIIQHCKFWQAPVMVYTPSSDVVVLRVLRHCSKDSLEVWDKHLNMAGLELFVVYLLFCGLTESIGEYIAICGADYINEKLTQRASAPRVAMSPVALKALRSFEFFSSICQDTINTARTLGIRVDLLLEAPPARPFTAQRWGLT